jgi:hypothetical protein
MSLLVAQSIKMSENVSIDEVCCLLEVLDELEEVALHLGLSEQTIQEIRGLSCVERSWCPSGFSASGSDVSMKRNGY